ncbi:hypothetical protein [Roseibium album]|uniref:hypothetical protein n=1 Tax=Roseibium album TaxID=311410 RepID=UPI00391AA0B2
MGRVKNLQIEVDEAEWEESHASFHCPICEKDVDGAVDLPVVYEHSDEIELPVSVMCYDCHSIFQGWVKTDRGSCEIAFDDYPDVDVTADPAIGYYEDANELDYFEWLAEEEARSARPVRRAFIKTVKEVQSLAFGLKSDQQSEMLARMLLTQSITALEVFLGDSLVFTVTKTKEAQEKLLKSKDLEIGVKCFALKDALGIEDFAKYKLLEHLRFVSFHNLQKTNKLFQVGMGFNILPDGEELELVQKAIKMRHDCVHRNGLDRETGNVHNIDQVFLIGLTNTLLRMVESVDEKVEKFETKFQEPAGN